jgi:hypothetical protein
MTAKAASLLAEIRRSGGDVRLAGRDTLKLVAPAALLPELAERVRAAKPMLLAVLEDSDAKAGAAHVSGGRLLNPWRNGATAQHPTAGSSSDRAILTPATNWHTRHCEALAYWSAFHPAGEAARLAWSEIENHWHMQHGERVPHWQCAGCREAIGGVENLTLGDGNRVHLHKLDCLLLFGERRRSEATAALQALGLDPLAALPRLNGE